MELSEEIYVAAEWDLTGNQRRVKIGVVNLHKRQMYFSELQDTEFYSNFESFVL